MKKEDNTPLQGSDYRRYLSSTRYDMMDSFLIDRDFTKSKVGSTFKVECRRLGYVDDLTRRTHERCYDDVWDIVLKPESNHVVSYK